MSDKKYKNALVIGKFDPFHLGHLYLIEQAFAQSELVTILIVDSKDDLSSAYQRFDLIENICLKHPILEFVVDVIPDIYDDNNSIAWADHTLEFLNRIKLTDDLPEVVFSSEPYGEPYARYMRMRHVMVDPDRVNVPISATAIRSNPMKNWDYIPNAIKNQFVTKVVVLGTESSGTSTLANQLGTAYYTTVVPEYGRIFCEAMRDPRDYKWTKQDFIDIAKVQQKIENDMVSSSTGLLICDTNGLATNVFYQFYMNGNPEHINSFAKFNDVQLYIITAPDFNLVDDGTRDLTIDRDVMHLAFIEAVKATGCRFMVATGSQHKRLAEALSAIDPLITEEAFKERFSRG